MNQIKNDIKIYRKLNDYDFNNKLMKASCICYTLQVNDYITYIKYQIQDDNLKDITYFDVISFRRLLHVSYYNSIESIVSSLDNNEKVLKFPKIPKV